MDVGTAPLAGPVVVAAGGGVLVVRGVLPVPPCEILGVFHTHEPLLGASDVEQSTERPEGLSPEVVAVLLVQHQDLEPRLLRLIGGDHAGESAADDDDISFLSHGELSYGPPVHPAAS